MTAKKAKEVLSTMLTPDPQFSPEDRYKAIKIGIEAINAYLKSQEAGWYPPGYKLPSETEE